MNWYKHLTKVSDKTIPQELEDMLRKALSDELDAQTYWVDLISFIDKNRTLIDINDSELNRFKESLKEEKEHYQYLLDCINRIGLIISETEDGI